jgi:hypothetical protein
MSSDLSQSDASDQPTFEELTAILTDPATLRGEYLSEEEQRRYRECQQSIVDAAIWLRPSREF